MSTKLSSSLCNREAANPPSPCLAAGVLKPPRRAPRASWAGLRTTTMMRQMKPLPNSEQFLEGLSRNDTVTKQVCRSRTAVNNKRCACQAESTGLQWGGMSLSFPSFEVTGTSIAEPGVLLLRAILLPVRFDEGSMGHASGGCLNLGLHAPDIQRFRLAFLKTMRSRHAIMHVCMYVLMCICIYLYTYTYTYIPR